VNSLLADDDHQQNASLILFLTGEAPRSRRAHRNLTAALEAAGLGDTPAREIDLLREPEQAIDFVIFATPALMGIDKAGNRSVLYGDLSDAPSLALFLSTL
jgi:circadian clock protein KaiB